MYFDGSQCDFLPNVGAADFFPIIPFCLPTFRQHLEYYASEYLYKVCSFVLHIEYCIDQFGLIYLQYLSICLLEFILSFNVAWKERHLGPQNEIGIQLPIKSSGLQESLTWEERFTF